MTTSERRSRNAPLGGVNHPRKTRCPERPPLAHCTTPISYIETNRARRRGSDGVTARNTKAAEFLKKTTRARTFHRHHPIPRAASPLYTYIVVFLLQQTTANASVERSVSKLASRESRESHLARRRSADDDGPRSMTVRHKRRRTHDVS